MNRIKTLFVVPSLGRAGAETQVVNLANTLDTRVFDKRLVTFERNLDQLSRLEVVHHHAARRYKFDLGPAKSLARLIDNCQVDVVHCTLQFALLYGWIASSLSRKKPSIVVAVHTTLSPSIKAELLNRMLYQWLMRRCARVVFVCDAQREYWLKKYPALSDKSVVVHNGVDPSRYDLYQLERAGWDLRRSLGIPEASVVIGHVAAFRPEKGHAVLLEAFGEVLEKSPDCYLLLAGDGALRPEIERLVFLKGLGERVRFLGNVSDVRPVLGASNFTVLPSLKVETFSMAMLESLCAGVPMIASDIGGAKEVVRDGETGCLVRPGDVAGLSNAMKAFIALPEQLAAMGRRGSELVRREFTQETMTRKMAEVLTSVFHERVKDSMG